MRVEQFIAIRYLRAKRRKGIMAAVSLISIVGVTVGVVALVVVLSVFNGFSGLVTQILVNFDPHIRIETAQRGSVEQYRNLITDLSADPLVAGASPFVQGKAMMVSRGTYRVVNIRGVDDRVAGTVSGIAGSIVLGKFTFQGQNENGIVLGMALADRLGALVGDTISIVSPADFELAMMQVSQPIIRRLRVVGIYESNSKDYDLYYAYIGLPAAQRLFRMGSDVSGIEVRLRDFEFAEALKTRLAPKYGNDVRILTWYDLHRDLYTVMKIEHWLAYIILGIIIGVASFNLFGLLTMSVMEKKRDIGILRAMGATRLTVIRIFIGQGVLVGIVGTVLGLGIGLGIVLLQSQFHLFPLDPTVYVVPALPVAVKISDLTAIALMSITMCSVAAWYPAMRAARLLPAEGIRWE